MKKESIKFMKKIGSGKPMHLLLTIGFKELQATKNTSIDSIFFQTKIVYRIFFQFTTVNV